MINPKGYVPALVFDDGTLLTENAAILDWIAAQSSAFPAEGSFGRTRHLQILAFMSTEIQKPFIPLFFTEDEEEKARLRQILTTRFNWIASRLEGTYIFGDLFTGADALLYVMLRWMAMVGLDTPPSLDAFIENVECREAVRATLDAEELKPLRRIGSSVRITCDVIDFPPDPASYRSIINMENDNDAQ